ncbi:MAG: hypothetical protein KDA42_07605 [Planctomycetales bacterium]|nr:hypothetical protein [Planctomycetales bacterium]
MKKRNFLAALALLSLLSPSMLSADEVRYFEQDGLTYKETRRLVQRPVNEIQYEQREQTVYREQLHTDLVETSRTYHHPVTEYRWVTVLKGRWNPLVQPYFTQQLMPVQTWQPREHIIRTPVQRRELIPETRTVQVPVSKQRVAQEEMISRVVVGPASGASSVAGVANGSTPVGGVARMENDPPRRSVQIPRSGTTLR